MTEGRCKIDIVTERYDLDDTVTRYATVDERLLTRWTGADEGDSAGYRTLAAWFNRRLLKTVYDEHGRETTGKRIESDYEALTGDDDLVREDVLDDLRGAGIDADGLLDDTVSWSTMRTHLKDCLGGEKPVREAETEWEQKSVSVARRVTASKVDEALRSLDSKGRLPGGSGAEVDTQILLSCPDCLIRIPFDDAIERGFVCEDHLGAEAVSE
ncbi:rod-determining factor RdfA [Salinigranum salinum]|uniref:rod-determining factor RdfA n=1 Tax=Salinigranum salinum TaxID=1364937 RepID=UPI001261014D|nr:rod-determining factor RdfA [Salinigranum salinum]